MAARPPQPLVLPGLSPWATRFGRFEAGDPFKYGGTVHSGFAPEQPSLHPKYFIDIPQVIDGSLNPDEEEQDRLFITEKYQVKRYGGYKTWQHLTFNRWVDFGRLGIFDVHSWNQFPPPTIDNTDRIERRKRGEDEKYSDFMAKFGPQEWRYRLESVLSRVIWCITRFETSSGWDKPDLGEANGLMEGKYTPIVIGDRLVRPLVNGTDLSLSEECHIHYTLAVTLVHELMHALLTGRYLDDDVTFGNHIKLEHTRLADPVVDFDGEEEIGYWFENKVFGGRASLQFTANFGGTGTPLMMGQKPTQGEQRWIMTSLQTSKLLSESFWTNPTIPKKSDNFFHWRKIFKGGIETLDRITQDPQVQETGEYTRLVQAYGHRDAVWKVFRAGWYIPHADRYGETLWSDLQTRKRLAAIPYWFNREHVVNCAYIARKLVQHMPWKRHRAFARELPTQDALDWNWYLHALGLLLMAAMPILRGKRTVDRPSWTYTMTPSVSASQNGRPHTIEADTTLDADSLWAGTDEAAASELYDPLLGRGRAGGKVIRDQLDYIEVLDRLIDRVKSDRARVEKQWVVALISARTEIRQKRSSGHYPANVWLDRWPFVMPAYESRPNQVAWNSKTAEWLPVW
ncbi:hypothetical protein F5Y18DRAFT_429743 [Xylariaceae sp. FL1019]|nr:hypothetical protein F5Y18DRAFT_429743 [Xylariaceae sp. FL1019]